MDGRENPERPEAADGRVSGIPCSATSESYIGGASVALFLLGWEAVSRSEVVPPIFLSSPTAISGRRRRAVDDR